MHRRDAMLRLGQLGLGTFTTAELLRRQASAAVAPPKRATSCIQIFLWGGPPQQDMWDIKPNAPAGIRSPFKPIATSAPGVFVSDQLPRSARQADKFSIVRSLTHPSTVHESSVYHMMTGRVNNTLISPRNQRKRGDFPCLGSMVSYFSPSSEMPASVTIPRPIGHDGVTYAGTYAGFLGPRHDPMELKEAPNSSDRPAHTLTLAEGLDHARLLARHGLLKSIEGHEQWLEQSRAADGLDPFRQQALSMLSSPRAKKAFDLSQEPIALRERYGANEYGESFLLARRMIEAGVRLVSIFWMYFMPTGRIANVWDNHGGTAGLGGITGYAMLKEPYCLPSLDRAFAALIEDLFERGLLDETLVMMAGEFGRTPRINAQQGRDHWGPCQSVVLAGGPVAGGNVFGASDAHAAYPQDDPVTPEDLLATTFDAMGIPPHALLRDREGRPHALTTGKSFLERLA